MKRFSSTWLFLLMFFLPGKIFAQQNDNKSCEFFKKAFSYYCEKKYNKAVKTINDFRSQNPGNPLSDESYYVTGIMLFESGKYLKAEKVFENILTWKNYSKYDTSFVIWKCLTVISPCKSIYIPEDLLNTQHESCIMLAEIGFKTKNYPFALKSVIRADRYFRYWYGCGTGDMQEDIRLAMLYSRYYQAVNKSDSAISIILPFVLEPAALPVNYYHEALDMVVKLMKTKYSTEDLKIMLDNAVNHMSYDLYDSKDKKGTRVYCINLLGVKIHVSPAYLFAKNKNVDEIKNYIRSSDFYNKLYNN